MYVVAILDQGTYATFPSRSSAPKGSIVFESAEQLEAALTTQSMDTIRARLLGAGAAPSASRTEAARRLWLTLSGGAPVGSVNWSYTPVTDFFGNRKIQTLAPVELIQVTYSSGKSNMADHFYRSLARQGRKLLDMLIEDGRSVLTHEQAIRAILARRVEITTRQHIVDVFDFYRGYFFAQKLLRRLTYLEFSTEQEFWGKNLLDKE